MEVYASREPFGFAMAVPSSKRSPNTVNTLVLTAFQCILTPAFITVVIFSLVVPYLFSILSVPS